MSQILLKYIKDICYKSVVDFKRLTDVSPLGVVLEPSKFRISFLTKSSVTVLKEKLCDS